MKGLREKFRKNEGFTLIEMLIVVAIIAILIAVSIPLIGSALDKARAAVDSANERSATGVATVYYLTSENASDDFKTTGVTKYYKVTDEGKQGTLVDSSSGLTAYGQTKAHKGQIIKLVIKEPTDTDDGITVTWEAPTT